ncbi:MAG: patatin-like phospholipase family protein [Myxococcota bacterium]|nr:patatin-like phospholipase family protein [Myxococcota bacterium]
MGRTFDVAFQGGGARGIVLNGALERLEKGGHRVGRVVGTSAGAIAASLVATGFTAEEMVTMSRERRADGLPEFAEYVMDVPTAPEDVRASGLYAMLLGAERSMHVPEGAAERVAEHLGSWLAGVPGVRSSFSFLERGGLHSGAGFTGWFARTLESKRAGLATVTLGALAELTGRDLTIVATDTTAARMIVLNHRTAPRVPLVQAVRMSMSIPLFFEEVVWRADWGTYLGEDISGHVIVDGGVLSNFPLRFVLPDASESVRAFMGEPPRDGATPLGLHIDPTLEVIGAPPGAHSPQSPVLSCVQHTRLARRVMALVETMLDGNDDTTEETHRSAICALPAKGYWATEFHMEAERVDALIAAGGRAMGAHLDRLESGASR